MPATIGLVYTTVAPFEAAQDLARKAIESGVATCCNLTQGLSIYRWNETVMEEKECFLMFKTSFTGKEDLLAWLKAHHPYETPAIVALDGETTPAFKTYVDAWISRTPFGT